MIFRVTFFMHLAIACVFYSIQFILLLFFYPIFAFVRVWSVRQIIKVHYCIKYALHAKCRKNKTALSIFHIRIKKYY